MKNIKLAVCARTAIDTNKEASKRLYVAKEFIDLFNKINVTLIPIFTFEDLSALKDICDGLLVPGSYANTDPKYYGGIKYDDVNYGEDEYVLDKEIINTFYLAKKPILGVCAGIQEINVFFGGTLKQKIKDHCANDKIHKVKLYKDTYLYDCYKSEEIDVNTLHYQAIDKLAPGFKISAISYDDIIEGIEKDNIFAVQWHPELMDDLKFFRYFIEKVVK